MVNDLTQAHGYKINEFNTQPFLVETEKIDFYIKFRRKGLEEK